MPAPVSHELNLLLGGAVWCVLAALATDHAFAWTAVFFLLGPLVVVPLGLELAARLDPHASRSRLLGVILRAQPLAAWAAAASFFAGSSQAAGGLALVWTALTVLVAADGIRRAWRRGITTVEDLCVATAALYLGAGGLLFACAAFGPHPPGIETQAVLETSTHLHFAGFAVLVIAALTTRAGSAASITSGKPFRAAVLAALLTPSLLVAGLLLRFQPLEGLGLLLATAGLAGVATAQLVHARRLSFGLASALLTVSSMLAIPGILVALSCALSRLGWWLAPNVLTQDEIVLVVGGSLALGFTVPALVGWRLAARESLPDLAPEPAAETVDDPPESEASPRQGHQGRVFAAILIAVAAASLLYRILVIGQLEQTSALFIGVPTLLAVLLALTPPARTSMGIMIRGITLALLASGPLLGEGFICIVMAAPLFYLIGIVAVATAKVVSRRRGRTLLVLLPLLPMSLEGVHEKLSFSREEEVVAERLVAAAVSEVERAVARPPRFERALPLALRVGFPLPLGSHGDGLDLGAPRRVRFGGGEGKPGELVLVVAAHDSGRVVFRMLEDSSHIAHWLGWRETEVRYDAAGPASTRVRVTVRFERRLDPAWYFRPLERAAVRYAAEYLIDTVATP